MQTDIRPNPGSLLETIKAELAKGPRLEPLSPFNRGGDLEACPYCRGYRLEASWCHVCKGHGVMAVRWNHG